MSNNLTVIEVYQGDTTAVIEFSSVSNSDVSSIDWSGQIVVRLAKCHPDGSQVPTGPALITNALVKDVGNTKFLAWLAPTDTATLPDGKSYIMAVEITNAALVPPLNVEQHLLIKVLTQGA
jgi:hypothetical protein